MLFKFDNVIDIVAPNVTNSNLEMSGEFWCKGYLVIATSESILFKSRYFTKHFLNMILPKGSS
jgi:hypothetical protein